MDTTALWLAHASGDPAAREQLLIQHFGLVHHVARRVSRGLSSEVELDELVSAGTLGLMGALDTFDPSRGLAFSTYAAPRIRGAILDELRRQDHVPRSVRRRVREISSARGALRSELGRDPSERETAAFLGVSTETLSRWDGEAERRAPLSLDEPSRQGRGAAPVEVLAGETHLHIEDRVSHGEEVEILQDALLGLPEKERLILTLYYFEELKLREIAAILDLTESRVSQIRCKAVLRLRGQLSRLREQVA
jgi:RNA polymerase sigma factor for flagellar operon FliA